MPGTAQPLRAGGDARCAGDRLRRPPRARSGASRSCCALWLTVLLTVIASGFAFCMRSEAVAARNAISLAQARALADGAVERTLVRAVAAAHSPTCGRPTARLHQWTEGEARSRLRAVDESSKIDLNTAGTPLLIGLMNNVGGLDADAAARIVDAILDWRDADDVRHPNGAEAADYRAADLDYGPANAPFESVGEFARVLGVTPAAVRSVADSLTRLLAAAPASTRRRRRATCCSRCRMRRPSSSTRFIARARRCPGEAQLPVPAFPPAQGFGAGAAAVWRIRAEATTARWCNLRPRSGGASRRGRRGVR